MPDQTIDIWYGVQDKCSDSAHHWVPFRVGRNDCITFGAWNAMAQPDAGFEP